MKPYSEIFLQNPTNVLASLPKMAKQQRVVWLYELFIDAAPTPLLVGKYDKALARIIAPYATELMSYLDGEYNKMTTTLTNANMRKEVAVKHYIMMKKLEAFSTTV